ncbi:ROK family protein [Streptacidiphilus sp. N1-3]|uniref:ROK family protein n=1 Tax=Streptacidiphilus alkalitolerans TaxID=3342712 RepID=A0ABV6X5Z8_9ACTN
MSAPSAVTAKERAAASGQLLAAVDIGGTKIAAGLVDRTGELLYQVSRPTPAQESGSAVLTAVHAAVEHLAADPRWGRVAALGIGSAGPVDTARGTVSPVNIPGWRDFPLVRSMAAHPALAGLPMVLGGDAVAMAAAEHWRGAARGHANALCIVVSTGVGAGLILDGAVYPGPTGNAGHLGHICVDLDGDPCACGSRGCVEGLASGTAIARRALRDGWQPHGSDASAGAVAASARRGDPIALAAFDRAAQALAAGIAATATLVEIDLAVIGGGVAQAGDLLFAPLRRHLARYATLSFTSAIRVVPAALGTDAGLVGAAALAAPRLGATAAPSS